MRKRSFRGLPPASPGSRPSYPTLDDFDRSSRRGCLAKVDPLGCTNPPKP